MCRLKLNLFGGQLTPKQAISTIIVMCVPCNILACHTDNILIACLISNSYTMATRDLPDIYALARGPQARGRGHIYQANPEWPWYK